MIMVDSHEGRKSGFVTRLMRVWSHNIAAWICLCGALLCLVSILAMRLQNSGGNLSDVLNQSLENMLFTMFAALTVGFAWEALGKNALLRELQHHTDKAFRDAGLSNTLADQGILHTTTDFEQEISWKEYIADADEIDVCWWAGLGWIQTHKPAIETAANENQLRIRYVIPDADDDNILTQMTAISGIKSEQLKESYTSVCDELQPLGSIVELHKIKKLPQYGMVRLGSRIVFFPYSHLRGRPQGRPTFVIDSNSALGKRLMRDFEELLQKEGKHHSQKSGLNPTP